MSCRVALCTPPQPGAVAILQLTGDGIDSVLEWLTGCSDWPIGRLRLSRLAGVDDGVAVKLSAEIAQLMPHGGPRVVQRLLDRLLSFGVAVDNKPDPQTLYPEARSPIEADMLYAMATAASPAAIDLLARQPELWREYIRNPESELCDLNALIHPPTVVVVGPPNVGKSTLTNALFGKSISLVADLPGTTRDWVGGLVNLVTPREKLITVRWLDTPGLRQSDDLIEQRAIRIAEQVIASADVLISMRDPETCHPSGLPRSADLELLNKSDRSQPSASDEMPISAKYGKGLDALQHQVIDRLGLTTLPEDQRWAFSPTLKLYGKADSIELQRYVN